MVALSADQLGEEIMHKQRKNNIQTLINNISRKMAIQCKICYMHHCLWRHTINKKSWASTEQEKAAITTYHAHFQIIKSTNPPEGYKNNTFPSPQKIYIIEIQNCDLFLLLTVMNERSFQMIYILFFYLINSNIFEIIFNFARAHCNCFSWWLI